MSKKWVTAVGLIALFAAGIWYWSPNASLATQDADSGRPTRYATLAEQHQVLLYIIENRHQALLQDAMARSLDEVAREFLDGVWRDPTASKAQSIQPLQVRSSRAYLASASSGLRFQIQGSGIHSTQARVFDLSGARVFESDVTLGASLQWNLMNAHGQPAPNGVYLYVLSTKGLDGSAWSSGVKKLMILR